MLARAVVNLETVEPRAPIARAWVWHPLQEHRRRFNAIASMAPCWLVAEILRASQHIIEDKLPSSLNDGAAGQA